MRMICTLILTSLLTITLPVHAQEGKESADPVVYKVEFSIHDGGDATAKAGRHYTMVVDTTGKGTFRVGERVPYATGSFQPGAGGASGPLATQYTYLDTGVNIDCRLRNLNGTITLSADIDISTISPRDKASPINPPNPTVAQIRMAGVSAVVSLGKPALVGSIDDPVTGRRFDVDVTVTKAN
jgi:hypothetical protein